MPKFFSIRFSSLHKYLFIAIIALLGLFVVSLTSKPALSDEKNPTFETLSKGDIGGEELMKIANDTKNMISWRKFAEEKLKQDKDSPVGHAVLGVVFHCAEGDLPRARHNLELAKKSLLRKLRSGLASSNSDGSLFIGVQIELCQVLGEMDDYKGQNKSCRRAGQLAGL